MDDQEIDELLKRAEAGDAHAQNQVDEWIARALGPPTTPPIIDVPRQGVVIGYDQLRVLLRGRVGLVLGSWAAIDEGFRSVRGGRS
ncbi:MAG: hypothetical protein U1F17_15755 [Burkholderiaceae bacterium]